MNIEITPTEIVDLKYLGPINSFENYINWKTEMDKKLVSRIELSTSKLYAVECQHQYYSDKAKTRIRTKRIRYIFKINRMNGDGYRYVIKSLFPEIIQFPTLEMN